MVIPGHTTLRIETIFEIEGVTDITSKEDHFDGEAMMEGHLADIEEDKAKRSPPP